MWKNILLFIHCKNLLIILLFSFALSFFLTKYYL